MKKKAPIVEGFTFRTWLSVEQAADYLGISKETVYRWIDRKKIPAKRLGKLWKFKRQDLDKWMSSK